VNVRVLDNDSDPDGASLTVIGASTTNGTAVVNSGRVRFTPSLNFSGTVVFSYTVSDGTASATGNVTVTVTPVNDAPVANNDAYTTSEDMTLIVPSVGVLSNGDPVAGVLANDTDAEGDTLTAVIVSDTTHGTLSLNSDGSFIYTPDADYYGLDNFTYSAVDGSDTGNVATVNINITPVSDPLRFASQQMTANGFELQVAGDASAYVISVSSNLQDWTPIFTNAAPTGPIVYTDTAAHDYPSRFYRVDAQ
jgi:VCBS repeat-containing protein